MHGTGLLVLLGVPALIWVGVQLLLFVYVPIRTKGKTKSDVRPTWVRVTVADLTPEARQVFGGLTADLTAAGFGTPVGLRNARATMGASGVQMLAADPAGGRLASMVSVRTAGTRTFALSVRTCFPDGKRVVTGASRSPRIFPPNPAADVVNFPWVRDVPTLLEAHRRHLDRAGYAGRRSTRSSPTPTPSGTASTGGGCVAATGMWTPPARRTGRRGRGRSSPRGS